MTKYPDIVHRYEQLNDSNPYESIMLEGALNVESYKQFEADKLTLTVTFNTRYTQSNVEPGLSIGATVSVNAIIGLPTLTDRKRILDIDENKASSKTMQLWLPLPFLDASPGLPIHSLSFSASDPVRQKQQTPSGK